MKQDILGISVKYGGWIVTVMGSVPRWFVSLEVV